MARELGRDKKKTFILASLALVGLIVGVRTFMKDSGTPEAVAAVAPVEAVGGPDPMTAQFGPDLVMAIQSDPEADHRTDEYIKTINHDITRDLFGFDGSYFTPIAAEAPESVSGDPGSGEPTTKPAAAAIDWGAIIAQQSARLTLQSTITSDVAIVMINGRVLGLGDVIDGFKVMEITSGACCLEKRGFRVTLKMAN